MHKREDRPEDNFGETSSMSGFEKASRGEWYRFARESDCRAITDKSWQDCAKINELAKKNRLKAIQKMLKICPNVDPSADIIFPVTIDYPSQIVIGKNTFVNMGLLHLSAGKLTIGNNCFIGPNAHFYTPNHHVDNLELRRAGWQYDAPITLGNDVWFGGDVTVLPGVTIGNNVVVGAGAVVTKDVPDNVVIGGNPARIIKEIVV